MGRFEQDIDPLRQALLLKPDYVEAHGNLGMALLRSGAPGRAVAVFERALQLNPNFSPQLRRGLDAALAAERRQQERRGGRTPR